MHSATYSNSTLRSIDPITKYDEALLAHLEAVPTRSRSGASWQDAVFMVAVGALLFVGSIALAGWLPPGQMSDDAVEQMLRN